MPHQDSYQQRSRPDASGTNSGGARKPSSYPRRPRPSSPKSPSDRPPSPRKRPDADSGSRWIRAILMVVGTLVFCIFCAVSILNTAYDVFGFKQEDRMIEVVVPEGASNAEIAALLKERGVIQHQRIFRIYADLKTKENQFQSGTYMFNSDRSFEELIIALKVGDYEKEEKRLMFPEGLTLREIAAELEKEDICSADEFLDYLQSAEYDYEFFNAIPNDPLRFRKLEGYIFPDTYDFYVGESVQDVARKFLNNFNKKMTDELQEQMLEMNMTIDETIILASVIQREAAKVEDMQMVSSVFHNRLALPETYPNLQSDVTIFYVNNNIKPYLSHSNQEMYDAYNTYACVGLPIGAICNPGMDAIEAALNPANSDYYFFVTDANEEFYYAETASKHYENIATAKQVGGEAHGIDTQ